MKSELKQPPSSKLNENEPIDMKFVRTKVVLHEIHKISSANVIKLSDVYEHGFLVAKLF